MKLETQIDYLMRSLKQLVESLTTIQPDRLDQLGQLNHKLHSATVNVTYSKEISKRKGMVVKFMSALICCKVLMNIQAAKLRVQNMQMLQWAIDARSVLTKNKSKKY